MGEPRTGDGGTGCGVGGGNSHRAGGLRGCHERFHNNPDGVRECTNHRDVAGNRNHAGRSFCAPTRSNQLERDRLRAQRRRSVSGSAGCNDFSGSFTVEGVYDEFEEGVDLWFIARGGLILRSADGFFLKGVPVG